MTPLLWFSICPPIQQKSKTKPSIQSTLPSKLNHGNDHPHPQQKHKGHGIRKNSPSKTTSLKRTDRYLYSYNFPFQHISSIFTTERGRFLLYSSFCHITQARLLPVPVIRLCRTLKRVFSRKRLVFMVDNGFGRAAFVAAAAAGSRIVRSVGSGVGVIVACGFWFCS